MTYIIAEIGVNHDGDIKKARRLIAAAAKCGVNAVKFQMFIAKDEIHSETEQCDYQTENTKEKRTMLEMATALELKQPDFKKLQAYCVKKGVRFLASVFDLRSLHYYTDEMCCNLVKIGSGDLTNAPLLLAAARKGVSIILSTGMADLDEIRFALSVIAYGYGDKRRPPTAALLRTALKNKEIWTLLRQRVVILQCTTSYPCPDEEINLSAMMTISKEFGLPVGFSDHSTGIGLGCAAAALGATIYEKHFTLNNDDLGPDHKASLNPTEMARCVREIRSVERGLGAGLKCIEPSAISIKRLACRNLVAWFPIKKGELFNEWNLWSLRTNQPGVGCEHYYNYIGRVSSANYEKGDLV